MAPARYGCTAGHDHAGWAVVAILHVRMDERCKEFEGFKESEEFKEFELLANREKQIL